MTSSFIELIKFNISVLKYIAVGVINTLLSLFVIMLCMYVFKMAYDISNLVGYIVGLINSFIWNKLWVFKKRGAKMIIREVSYFLGVFLICYLIQFLCLKLFVERLNWNEYLSQIISMVIYTVPGYLLNRFLTFKNK